MKKFTLMLLATFFAVVGYAQKPLAKAEMFAKTTKELRQTQIQARSVSRSSTTTRQKSPRKSLGLVTPPTDATPETYYTASGALMVNGGNGFADGGRETIQVIVDGSDIYIAGLAYWVENAWIKGTIDGTTATFPAAQQVNDDASYPEWISGSEDGETPCDIVFNFDQVAGVLECTTTYIGECSAEDGFSIYAYWNQPIFTKDQPVAPEVVVLPDGLEILPYAMSYDEGSKGINVAVDGNDVYFQGMSHYLPEAWVKGTKEGNFVTFPAMQYMGEYESNGSSYFFYNGEATFTYDPDAGTYTAEGLVFGVLADQYYEYYDGKYTNPVLSPVVEKAAMPAAPEITNMENGSYGWYIDFNVPAVDVNGEELAIGKLSYMIYTDTEGTVTPLTFTPTTHSKLTEDMTEIPYGFTENYDFYTNKIYLNDLYSADWTRIGIQSIYRGGGEENKTEIQWFDILPEPEAIEAPEGLVTEAYALNAYEQVASQPYTYQMQVGFDGNDVYFKGVSDNTADMWLKGSLSADGKTVTIPANQYMGQIDIYGIYTFDYFFSALGEDNETLEDIVLNYNAELGTFTTDQTLVLHDGKRSLGEPYQKFTDVVITKMLEFAATPADPSIDGYKFEGTDYPYIKFNIPAKDTEGNEIITSKLFYSVWVEIDGVEKPFTVFAIHYRDVTENWTEIPYEWDDEYDIYKGGSRFYINPGGMVAYMTKIGIQSIYYGGGERNTSNIVWMDNPVYDEVIPDDYGLYVAGKMVMKSNADDILFNGGTFTYNPDTNTLTINGSYTRGDQHMIDCEGPDGLTIYVAKEAELSGDNPDSFFCLKKSTTITGPGKLTLGGNIAVLNGKQLSIKDANIEIKQTDNYAIRGNKGGEKLKIVNSNIHAESSYQAIANFDGGIAIYDCMLEDGLRIIDDFGYICKTDGSNANIVNIYNQDYITGIKSLSDSHSESEVIYNLAGQRLNKPVKGVNIIDGKKVLR